MLSIVFTVLGMHHPDATVMSIVRLKIDINFEGLKFKFESASSFKSVVQSGCEYRVFQLTYFLPRFLDTR